MYFSMTLFLSTRVYKFVVDLILVAKSRILLKIFPGHLIRFAVCTVRFKYGLAVHFYCGNRTGYKWIPVINHQYSSYSLNGC